MGIWVTGTSKVFRQGVEIVLFFDIMLKCFVWCMDEARDQLSGGPQSVGGGMLGMGFRTNMQPQDASAIHGTSPTPPQLSGLDFPEQDFIVSSQPAHPQPDPQKAIS